MTVLVQDLRTEKLCLPAKIKFLFTSKRKGRKKSCFVLYLEHNNTDVTRITGGLTMAVVEQLLRLEDNGTISFGNHELTAKAKVEDFPCGGDLLKVKTYNAMTKLEKNGMFLYESVPGTSVINFSEKEDGVEFEAEGAEDAQITVGLKDDTEYEVWVGGDSVGKMCTGLGGKLSLSVELAGAGEVAVKIIQAQ